MDLDLDLWSVGWREGLIAIIALLLLYILVIFLRMRRLQRRLIGASDPPSSAQSAVAAYTAIQEPMAPVPASQPPGGVAPVEVAPPPAVVNEAPSFPWNEPPPEIPGQALIEALQREVEQLRCEVDELRGEVLAAREELRSHFSESVETPEEGSSPIYSGAMQLAQQGHDAMTIAQHCGITRAEADLVVAMARSRGEGF